MHLLKFRWCNHVTLFNNTSAIFSIPNSSHEVWDGLVVCLVDSMQKSIGHPRKTASSIQSWGFSWATRKCFSPRRRGIQSSGVVAVLGGFFRPGSIICPLVLYQMAMANSWYSIMDDFYCFSNSTRVTNSQWSLQCLIKPWWWVSRRVATPGKIGHEWLILVLKHPFRETIHVIPALHVIKTPRNLGEMLWGMRIGIPKHGLLEQNHFISQVCTLRQINRLESPGC